MVTDLVGDKAESQASNGENLECHRTLCPKVQELMTPATSESVVEDGLTTEY